jgi:hypothetical protein
MTQALVEIRLLDGRPRTWGVESCDVGPRGNQAKVDEGAGFTVGQLVIASWNWPHGPGLAHAEESALVLNPLGGQHLLGSVAKGS